jgi:hypothetical protein
LREWCDDADLAACSPRPREPWNAKQKQDLNVNDRPVTSRERCYDYDSAPSCSLHSRAHRDRFATSREWRGDPKFAACSPVARKPRNAQRDQDLNVCTRPDASSEWCNDYDLAPYFSPAREPRDTKRDQDLNVYNRPAASRPYTYRDKQPL